MRRALRRWLLVGALALAGSAPAFAADGGRVRPFGLVIGSNTSDDPERAPLRYADDDAVQNASLLTQLGGAGGVVLLTRLDAESRALYPHLDPTPPTRGALRAAVAKLDALIVAAREAGDVPVFYFFYTGHGDVQHNEGYVNLEDGRFTRSDLLDLLGASRATWNHVVIDACKSYFLVFDRGAGGQRRPVVGRLLEPHGGRALPANTGVLLSTSSAADSHEWEAFQGGVFSHEVRSALRGAADVDLDRRITYHEAAAFVWNANAAIPYQRFRPAFFARPPGGGEAADAVLVALAGARGDRLFAGPGAGGHRYVQDARGLRVVDFHAGPEQRLALLLPSHRPLFVRRPGSDAEVELPAGPAIELAQAPPRRIAAAARGAEHLAFRKLFVRPFDEAALAAFDGVLTATESLPPPPSDLTWARHGLGVTAAVLAVAGGTLSGLAFAEREGVTRATSGVERRRINGRIDDLNVGAVSCYAVAGGALAAFLVWTLWPEDDVEVDVLPTGGPGVGLAWEF